MAAQLADEGDRTLRNMAYRLASTPTASTKHMMFNERVEGIEQMLADLKRLALADGCIAAAWALEYLSSPAAADYHSPADLRWYTDSGWRVATTGKWLKFAVQTEYPAEFRTLEIAVALDGHTTVHWLDRFGVRSVVRYFDSPPSRGAVTALLAALEVPR